jgi:hypothetical protein
LAQISEQAKKNLKIYIIDGSLAIRFGVTAGNESEAKKEARKLVKKLMESEILGSAGWSFELEEVKEAKPVRSR